MSSVIIYIIRYIKLLFESFACQFLLICLTESQHIIIIDMWV